LEFTTECCDSNFRGNLKLGQKGDLFQLKLSITWRSLENFEQPKDHIFVFSKLGNRIIGKRASTSQPARTVQSGAALNRQHAECSSVMPTFAVSTMRTAADPRRYSAVVTHLCTLPAVILIRSSQFLSEPRYFPYFASHCAIYAAQCYSSIGRRHRVGPHPRATLR
jgi:hypothetical protein